MPKRYILTVEGMHCAACAETVAKALKSVKGVKSATVNFATERVLVEIDDSENSRNLVIMIKSDTAAGKPNQIVAAVAMVLSSIIVLR